MQHDAHRPSIPQTPAALGLALLLLGAAPLARAQTSDDVEVEIEVDASTDAPADTPAPPSAPMGAGTAEGDADAARLRQLEADLRALTARLAELEAARAQSASEQSANAPEANPSGSALDGVLGGLTLSGYVQADYLHSELSEDQLQQGRVPLNQDGFSVRRGRLRLAGTWTPVTPWLPVGFELEIDGNTTGGPNVSVRRANAAIAYKPEDSPSPWALLRVGLTEIPFGLELRQSQEHRLFMERTTGSEALFAGPTDVGARLSGTVGFFTYDLAATNGTPVTDRGGAFAFDPTAAPDWVGRLGVDHKFGEWLHILGGVSALYGTGFHPGREAEKGRLEWRDLNEDGVLSTGETVAVPPRGATPSENFERWAVGADVSVAFTTPLGATRVFGEVLIASNLDRTLFVADPVLTGYDVRELSGYVAVVQDLTEWAFAGVRYDVYDPDIDLLDSRRGQRVPVDATIHTLSPLLGARLLGHLRLSVQYDAVFDALGRNDAGIPSDLRNDRFTVRLHGEL